MPVTWRNPHWNVSITHPDNLLPCTFTFPCFPDFREIFLPHRCKHLYSHSSNICTPSYGFWVQCCNNRRPVGTSKRIRSKIYTGMSKNLFFLSATLVSHRIFTVTGFLDVLFFTDSLRLYSFYVSLNSYWSIELLGAGSVKTASLFSWRQSLIHIELWQCWEREVLKQPPCSPDVSP